jgi:hypothetical protein
MPDANDEEYPVDFPQLQPLVPGAAVGMML